MSWDLDWDCPDHHVIVDPLVLAQLCDRIGRRQRRPPALKERCFDRWAIDDRDKPSLN